MQNEVLFTRSRAVAGEIERRVQAAMTSVDAALYRLNHPQLAYALHQAIERGVRVRLAIDRSKFEATPETQSLLSSNKIPFRLASGRGTRESKMHHKFAVLDGATVLAGSYNWTLESEEGNYENLVILHDPCIVEAYVQEFNSLWAEASSA